MADQLQESGRRTKRNSWLLFVWIATAQARSRDRGEAAASTLSAGRGIVRGMNVTSITPLVTTSQLARTRAFYVDLLGCEVSYDSDHYLGIRAAGPGSPELGFMPPDAMAPHTFAGEGLFFVLNVPSADREYGRLFAAGAELLGPPSDQPWGMRSFALRDPNGVLVIVAHAIPAAVEYQANFR